MQTTFLLQLFSLLYLATYAERILYPTYCYDHYTIILLSFSANFSYENFTKYLIDFADISDCSGNNLQIYYIGFNPVYGCDWEESKPQCIRKLLNNETLARQIYD